MRGGNDPADSCAYHGNTADLMTSHGDGCFVHLESSLTSNPRSRFNAHAHAGSR